MSMSMMVDCRVTRPRAVARPARRHGPPWLPALLLAAAVAELPGATASTISLYSTGSSSMPFTVTGTVFNAATSQSGTIGYTGVFTQEYLSSTAGNDSYRITTTATYFADIFPPVANSAINNIIDKIIRDFAPRPPRPPIPPVPSPPRPVQTVASVTDNDFQLDYDVTGSELTMSGTVTATPSLWTFGFDCQLLQPLPDFTGDVVVAMEADGLLERIDSGPGKSSGGSPRSGGGGSPWRYSGSAAPTLNATESVTLTLKPSGFGKPSLDLSLDVNAYWSLDYGTLPYESERIIVSSTLTNSSAIWFSNGVTTGSDVPEIDPLSAGSVVGVLVGFLGLLERRRDRRGSLGVGSPVAEVAPQPGLREPQPSLGRLL